MSQSSILSEPKGVHSARLGQDNVMRGTICDLDDLIAHLELRD